MKWKLLGLVALIAVTAASLWLVSSASPSDPAAPGSTPATLEVVEEPDLPTAHEAPTTAAAAPRALEASATGCRVRVLDSRGAPIAGLHVGGSWEDPSSAQPWLTAVTDAEGRAFLACPAGACSVHVNVEPEVAALGSAGKDLVLEPARIAELELVLPDARSRLTAFVHDEKGVALKDVYVSANCGPGATNASRDKRPTDAAGLVSWQPIVAGLWTIRIENAPERLDVRKDFRAEVEVGAGASPSVDILLPAKATLIVDLSDTALAAQLVEIDIPRASPSRKGWPFREPVATWLLPAGEWIVATQWKEDFTQWSPAQALTLVAGETRSVKLVLVDGEASLGGRIVDRRGVPIVLAGVHVSVMRPAAYPAEAPEARRSTEKTAHSDANGVWRLAGLPAGEAWLNLELRASKQRFLADDMAPSRPLDLQPGHRDLGDFVVDSGIALRVRLPEAWLAQARANEINVEAAFGPEAASGNARRRRLTRKDDAFVFDHGAIDTYALRIVDKQGKTLATATCTADPSTAEGATVDVTPQFTP